ncbi:hypothetical protein H4R18_004126 [Coemansia javaensis]|uniref:Uncharacterized protein n=1 Tax=Coemansia javaensis TaxID=2761396 RepID=A0A9W8LGP7_9FUNG|nr:hypothetical protein H4R18_004126 [Coemansia javaensis]
MGYEECCCALWERTASQRAGDAAGTARMLERALAELPECAPLSRAQLVESLAVAASYAEADPDQPPAAQVQQGADRWLAAIAEQLGIVGSGGPVLGAALFRELCAARVQPYFARASGGSQQQQQFALAGDARPATLIDAPPKWKQWPQSVAAFVWAFRHLADSEIQDAVPWILPVVVALADDYECGAKLRGLRLAQQLLARADGEFLRRSGVGAVIDSSARGCLTYRSDAGDRAPALLAAAFQTAIAAGDVVRPSAADPQRTAQWWTLVDRLITNDVYIAENVAATAALCAQIEPLCRRLGPAIARYLRALVGVVVHPLRSQAHLAPAVCAMHQVLVQQIQALAAACPERVRAYACELVAAMAVSWDSTASPRAAALQDQIARLRSLTLDAVRQIAALDPAAVAAAVQRLDSGRPGVFGEWAAAVTATTEQPQQTEKQDP